MSSSGGASGSSIELLAPAPTGGDDAAMLGLYLSTALAQRRPLRLLPGQTYRYATSLNPTGIDVIMRDAILKPLDGITARNAFAATGPWTLRGGELDGNKANTTDPGVNTDGCGVFVSGTAAGWAGRVRLLEDVLIHDWWQSGLHLTTDITTLTDADNAPDSAIYIERAEVHDCAAIGVRLEGIGLAQIESLYTHDHGSHGVRTYLCRAPRTPDVRAMRNGGHGMTSLYCVDQRVDGQFDNNGNDGLVIGGDASSTTINQGRRFQVGRVIARGNTSHGVCLDATKSGSNLAVPVNGEVEFVLSENNGGDGFIINSSQYVNLGEVQANGNTGHGLDIASSDVSFDTLIANNNQQRPLALQGSASSPNWGNHRVGIIHAAGNSPDNGITLGTVLAPCTWAMYGTSLTQPPAVMPVTVRTKPAATSRVSTTVLTADPDLQFLGLGAGVYVCDGELIYDASTTGDFAISWNLPTGASIEWTGDGIAGTATSATAASMNRVVFTGATGPNIGGVGGGLANAVAALPQCIITVPTAGDLVCKWAQNTSDTTATVLEAGSWLRLTQIA